MRNLTAGLTLMLTASLLSSVPSFAYPRLLTPEDIKAAVEYGKTRREQDLVDDRSPYFRTPTGVSGGFVLLYTPWLHVAAAARKAASQYREPTEAEIQEALSQWTGKLYVFAYIADQGERFWDNSHGVILQGEQAIQPIQKEAKSVQVVSCRTTPCTTGTGAAFFFSFPDEKIDNSGKVDIVIIFRGGFKEVTVNFNLGELR